MDTTTDEFLYHGTLTKFDHINLEYSRTKIDFGKGFYLTIYFEQAAVWACKSLRRKYTSFTRKPESLPYAYVQKYILNYEELKANCNICEFNEYSIDWLHMIKDNRMNTSSISPTHDYDVVCGPLADGNVQIKITLSDYVDGLITDTQALEQLKYPSPNFQISFHTQKALKYLKPAIPRRCIL